MSVFYDLNKTPRNILNQAIVRAIISENNGALFDPSDLSTLFQDAAGTTPVTAVEQPVGKMLDKSGNGYHATQPITASRPTLSARYNLLTKTEDFSDAVWGKVGVTVSGRTISFSASNTSRVLYAITGGGDFTMSCRFSEADAGKIIRFGFWASGLDGLGNGNSLDIVIPQNGFVSFSKSNVVSLTNVGLINASSGVAQSVTLMNGFGISLTKGTTSGPYQRVNTATDYDTDERYFKKYLRFDGVDDYLNLPYMGLYAGGAASIVCARDAVSQSNDTYIISERSTTDADPKYFPSRQLANGGNMDTFITDDAGAVVLDTVGSPFSGVANAVVRSVIDTGNNIKLFKNGQLAANDNYTRNGTLTLNNTTIGASVSTTTSNYASMKLYGLIVTKSALTDAQRIACERYLGRKSGVQL